MKKILFTTIASLFALLANSQSLLLESYSSKTNNGFPLKSGTLTRRIDFTNTNITISNFYNRGEPLNLKIDSLVKKEYSNEGICTWYYCKLEKYEAQQYEKYRYILILSKNKLIINEILDEVYLYKTILHFEDVDDKQSKVSKNFEKTHFDVSEIGWEEVTRFIVIRNNTINIPKWFDNGEPLDLNIDRVVDKITFWDESETWYYCYRKNNTSIEGTEKYILVKSEIGLILFFLASEVDIITTTLRIKN